MSSLFPLPYCAPGREGTGHDYVLNLVLSDLEGGVGWGRWQGRREEILMVDSQCCMAETDTL